MAKYFRSTLTNRQQKNLSFIFVVLLDVCACVCLFFFSSRCYSPFVFVFVMLYHSDLPLLLPVADVMTTDVAIVVACCVAVAFTVADAFPIDAFGYLLNFHCTTSLSFTRTHLR